MKHKYLLPITLAIMLLCHANVPAQKIPDIVEKTLDATVYIEMYSRAGTKLGIGSGFFVRPNLIATNYHVIVGAARGTAKRIGKSNPYKIEGIAGIDTENDLALLKVNAPGIKPLALGDSSNVEIGETVYVVDNSRPIENMFSEGIIRQPDASTPERLQMTASTLHSSGGPMVNSSGEVIGVAYMIVEGGYKSNLAIPSRFLSSLLAQPRVSQRLGEVSFSIFAETYFIWGNTKSEQGDHSSAINDYTQAIRLKPDYADAYYTLGVAKATLEQYKEAMADFDTAIRLKPDYVQAYLNRGFVKLESGQYDTAIADFDTAIGLKPDFAEAYHGRGRGKARLGQYFEAITDYNTAIRLKPNRPLTHYNRGLAKLGSGQYNAAINDFDTAIRLKLDFAEAYADRGLATHKLGQYNTAITDLDTAIRLKPDFDLAYYNRGVIKYKIE